MQVETGVAALQRSTLWISASFVLIVIVLVVSSGVRLGTEGALRSVSPMAFFLAGSWLALRRDPMSRAGHAGAAFGIAIAISSLGAATSMLVLRWGFPQADLMLARTDAAFGIDVREIAAAVAGRQTISERLWIIYSNSIIYLLYAIPVLALFGQRLAVWRAVFVFVGTLASICLLHGLVPAKGSYVLLDPDLIARFPAGAGVYAFSTFDQFHGGTPEVLSFATLNGVACFPSFHTAAALIMAQLFWGWPLLRPTAAIWAGIVIFSTIPMGGHYVIDLVGGGLIFALWSTVAHLIVARVPLPRLALLPTLRPAS